LTDEQSTLLDVGQDNVHAIKIDRYGYIEQLGQTSELQVRTDDIGRGVGRLWLDYNCDQDKRMKIYMDNTFLDGERKPDTPVLEFLVDLESLFSSNPNFVAGFTAASNSLLAENADVTAWVFEDGCGGNENSATEDPRAAPTLAPIGNILCANNGILRLSVGSRSNVNGAFVDISSEEALLNVIDCLGPGDTETHNQQSHVWWVPHPLELVFDLTTQYTITDVLFWNHYEDFYNVDRIDFSFISNSGDTVIYTFYPRDGINPAGINQNPITAERWTLPSPTSASKILAYMTAENTRVDLDFQNIVFLTT
jgi:hypothetical protein